MWFVPIAIGTTVFRRKEIWFDPITKGTTISTKRGRGEIGYHGSFASFSSGFDSLRLHQIVKNEWNSFIVQMEEHPSSKREIGVQIPLWEYKNCAVEQWLAQKAHNLQVAGHDEWQFVIVMILIKLQYSNPACATNICGNSSKVERLTSNERVVSSSLTYRTN